MRATISPIIRPLILFFIISFCFILPSAVALAAPAARPSFYADVSSHLAHISLRYAEQSEPVPAFLERYGDDDDKNDSSPLVVATFAGGCFWGLELAYQREPGVIATCVGYTQGTESYPMYAQVCAEETGHTEAVLLLYDPNQVTYARLADLLFDRIPDPTMLNRVGRDRGTQYRTGMYAHSATHLDEAQTAFDREDKTWQGRSVVTEVKRATEFWPAEEAHQRYLIKGGRFGRPQSGEKGAADEIRCYG